MAIQSWSTTAADNDDADGTINWTEGQTAASVNNSARAMMAAIAVWRDAMGGAKASAGSSNAYTLTTGLSLAAYSNGFLLAMEANHTNTGAATIAIDSLSAKDLKTPDGSALSSGAITSGGIYFLVYESGADIVQVLNAGSTVTLASLGLTANGISLVTAANYAAMRALLDLEAGTDFLSISAIAAAYQPLAAALTSLASASANGISLATAADYAAMRTLLDLEVGVDFAAIPTTGQLPLHSFAYLRKVAGSSVSNGNTDSGSNLQLVVIEGTATDDTGGTAQTGTWKNVSGLTQSTSFGVEHTGGWIRTV